MILATLFVLVGLALLTGGGELVVRGATGAAAALRVSARVVGVVVVSVGTSLPELAVSVGAGLKGNPSIAMGNVVGSNIYNVLLILGLCAMVRPLKVDNEVLRGDWPLTMAALLLAWFLAADGTVGRPDGLVLLLCFALAIGWTLYRARTASIPADGLEPMPERGAGWAALDGAGGLVLLVGGGELLVRGATTLAYEVGLTERVVALTVVAVGTSLPELVTSLIATRRGEDDVAVGNIVGSNLFNALGILGVAALVMPLEVSPLMVARDVPVMVGVFALLFPMLVTGRILSRVEGTVLFVLSIAYTAWLLVV